MVLLPLRVGGKGLYRVRTTRNRCSTRHRTLERPVQFDRTYSTLVSSHWTPFYYSRPRWKLKVPLDLLHRESTTETFQVLEAGKLRS